MRPSFAPARVFPAGSSIAFALLLGLATDGRSLAQQPQPEGRGQATPAPQGYALTDEPAGALLRFEPAQ